MSQRDAHTRPHELDNVDSFSRLHSSLQASFVALPPAGIALTSEQLEAIFGGDLRVLGDLARLAYQSDETEAE